MHYTWGPQFKKGDTLVWEFDKRKYTEPKHEKEVGWWWGASLEQGRQVGLCCDNHAAAMTCAWELSSPSPCQPLLQPSPCPLQLPKLPLPPPFEEGWKLQDGIPVTRDLYDTLVLVRSTCNSLSLSE